MFGATLTSHLMILAACALFLFSTMHVSINVARLIIAFVRVGGANPEGIVPWLATVSEKTYVLKSAIYILQTLTGDAVIIYRCFKVYRSFRVVLAPCILWCAVVATSTGVLRTFSTTSTNVFARTTTVWVSSFWATTLATNLTSTILLAYRIWKVDHAVAETRARSPLKGVLRVVLDAGALYSVTLLSALIPFICKSEGQYVVLDMITPIISIAFYMVLIRVGLSRAASTNSYMRSSPTTIRNRGSIAPARRDDHYSMKPLEVHIAQLTETDGREAGSTDTSMLGKAM
ncbi:hypothetical protein OE88DRAFT_1628210 [Heliocybe sulcata]|uniref:Uncharacterized protein n=1 Tax=Heliocybe sulcata TaxID=5364 RepID=A0A5C3N482_9AGAM|nr:hypothetical protein OE88DRAFT_1628210 [Heliocybe sulcata]